MKALQEDSRAISRRIVDVCQLGGMVRSVELKHSTDNIPHIVIVRMLSTDEVRQIFQLPGDEKPAVGVLREGEEMPHVH